MKHYLVALALVLSACGKSSKTSSQNPPQSGAAATALLDAAARGDLEAVQREIAGGADLNQVAPIDGSTPLIAATSFDRAEIVRVLIEAGADLEKKKNDGATPLIVAAFLCREEVVKLLLEAGADKNARNNTGSTALESLEVPWEAIEPLYKFIDEAFAATGLGRLDLDRIQRERDQVAELLR